jgi:hypothetical protein
LNTKWGDNYYVIGRFHRSLRITDAITSAIASPEFKKACPHCAPQSSDPTLISMKPAKTRTLTCTLCRQRKLVCTIPHCRCLTSTTVALRWRRSMWELFTNQEASDMHVCPTDSWSASVGITQRRGMCAPILSSISPSLISPFSAFLSVRIPFPPSGA